MILLGRALLLLRLKRGLTQQELARRSRIPRSTLSAIETGGREPSLKTVRALALALNIRPGVLVDGVTPGEAEKHILSRRAVERIADAVVSGRVLSEPKEQALAGQLKHVMSSRLRAAGFNTKGTIRLGRATDRAWLMLSCYPKPVIESLISRVLQCAARQ